MKKVFTALQLVKYVVKKINSIFKGGIMNIMRMDFFIADYLDNLLKTSCTQDECDVKAEDYSNQIHQCINSEFWEDEWMAD